MGCTEYQCELHYEREGVQTLLSKKYKWVQTFRKGVQIAKTDFSNISGQNNHPEIFSREFSGSGYVYPQGRFHMWAQVDEG